MSPASVMIAHSRRGHPHGPGRGAVNVHCRAEMRVLFVQPNLNPPGGANGVAAWMLQTLASEHRVALLAEVRPEFDAVNRYFGTSLNAEQVTIVPYGGVVMGALCRAPLPLWLLRGHLLLRRARQLAPEYDLLITAANESDFGKPGVQYVHYPKFEAVRPDVDLRWFHHGRLVHAYREACRVATGFSMQRMRENLTLVNSQWTADLYRRTHGVEPIVLRPPVAGDFPSVPWDRRSDDVVSIGRISPEKRLDMVMDIIAVLRAHGCGTRLHIIGTPDDDAYYAHVRGRARALGDWVELHEDISRTELIGLVSRVRYGIHAMRDEHFGMGVAEMVHAGCIVFAHDSGGQREILLDDRLLFHRQDEAVAKIQRVLEDRVLREDLRRVLAERARDLGTDNFVRQVRQVVATWRARVEQSAAVQLSVAR